ncbi:MAG: thiol reductant ABC exporter subunit CydD [Patulibacter minatonensis]
MRRPATDPGRALLARDPGIRRHVRRSTIAAGPLALLVAAQGYGLAAMVVALAQQGRFDRSAAAVFVVAAGLRGALNWWLERAGRRAAGDAISRLRQELVGDAARLATSTPGALRPGEVAADAITQLPAIERYVGRFLAGGPIAGVTTVVVFVAVLLTDPLSALLLAPTVPLLGVFMWLVGAESGRIADRRLASLQQLGAHLLDVLRGLVDLRAHGRAGFQRSQVRVAARAYRLETMATLRTAFMSGLVLELIAMLGTALVAVFGGVRLAQGGADLAAILPALVLAPELYAPIRRLGAGYHDAADARAALTRLAAVAEAAADAPVAGRAGGPAAPHASAGSIVLRGVTLSGGDDRADRLADVSAELRPGTTTALVGPSGAGKSSLAHLVLGLAAPTAGHVCAAGGIDLQTIDLTDWHAGAAWVPQDPVLLPATLRDNARLAAPGADDAAVRGALADAGLSTLLAELPDGLDTPLGEGGARLSSGELRRLALARALLAGAELLVLDEPTAQLDALTAGALLTTLARVRRDRTTLLITHDDAVAEMADQVLHLDGGRIVRTEQRGRGSGLAGRAASAGLRGEASSAPAASPVAPEPLTQPVRMSLRTALRLIAPARGERVWRDVRRAIGLGLLSAVAAIAVLSLSGGLIVEAATQPPVLALTAVIVLVRMFSIMRALGRYGERLLSHDAALTILESVRVRVFDHVSRHVPGRGSDRSTAALDGAVGDVDRAADLLIRVVVPGAAAVASISAATLVAAVVSPEAALAIASGCAIVGALAGHVALTAGRALADAEPARAELAREVVTALDAGPELLLSGRTADQQARIAARSAQLEGAAAAHGTRGAAVGAIVGIGTAVVSAAVAALLAPAVADGSLGQYAGRLQAALVLGALAATERLEGITEAGLALPGATAAVARLAPALLEVEPRDADATTRAARLAFAGPTPALIAEHVVVERGGRAVLRDVSMVAEPGEVVSVVGESGAGKSTLLLVLAGLLPCGGSARIGMRELTALDDEARSERVLLVPSAPHLFGGSLAANLRLAAPAATDGELDRALRAVGLGPWVDALPEGLATQLGEGGATASGGQRQRIGLARAVLSPAPLVLLDEPASHLPEADATAALRAVLRARPGRGAVLVSHRAAERRLATREVLLERGHIAAPAASRGRRAAGRLPR